MILISSTDRSKFLSLELGDGVSLVDCTTFIADSALFKLLEKSAGFVGLTILIVNNRRVSKESSQLPTSGKPAKTNGVGRIRREHGL
jgi:hypothetical protein